MPASVGIVNKTYAVPGIYYVSVIARDKDSINPVSVIFIC